MVAEEGHHWMIISSAQPAVGNTTAQRRKMNIPPAIRRLLQNIAKTAYNKNKYSKRFYVPFSKNRRIHITRSHKERISLKPTEPMAQRASWLAFTKVIQFLKMQRKTAERCIR